MKIQVLYKTKWLTKSLHFISHELIKRSRNNYKLIQTTIPVGLFNSTLYLLISLDREKEYIKNLFMSRFRLQT